MRNDRSLILVLILFIVLKNNNAFGQSAEEFLHLGNVSNKAQNFTQAIDDYTKAIQTNPHLEKAYYNRGYAFLETKKYKQAFADLNLAIEINPQDASAYHIRGIAYFYRKKYPQAIADYSKAIELEPENIRFYVSRMSAYFKVGNNDKTWKDVITIQKLGGTVNPTIINILKNKKYRDQP